MIEKLKPTYRLGCKRIVFSSNFRENIAKPNVILLKTAIKEVTANAIITEDGVTEEIDILVLGTGFKTQHGVLGNIESKFMLKVLRINSFSKLTLLYLKSLEMRDNHSQNFGKRNYLNSTNLQL